MLNSESEMWLTMAETSFFWGGGERYKLRKKEEGKDL